MTIRVALGTVAYDASASPVQAHGYRYRKSDLSAARKHRIPQILEDTAARAELTVLLQSLASTAFGQAKIVAALQPTAQEPHSRGWREGEALAEAWLVDHRDCEFPWPLSRDLRHPRASLPGAEFVGFCGSAPDARFVFGQVKTSKEKKSPPQLVKYGETCLINQMLQLRDEESIKTALITYLGFRCKLGCGWEDKYHAAAKRYFASSGSIDIVLFGVLIRDVDPDRADLDDAVTALKDRCPRQTTVEFCAIYLPPNSIPPGPQHRPRGARKKGGSKR